MVTLKNNSRVTYGSWPSTEGLVCSLAFHTLTLCALSSVSDNGGEGDYGVWGRTTLVTPLNQDSPVTLDNLVPLST